jgi:hypothetical protein
VSASGSIISGSGSNGEQVRQIIHLRAYAYDFSCIYCSNT